MPSPQLRAGRRAALLSLAALLLASAFTVLAPSLAAAQEVDNYFGTEKGSGSLGGEFSAPGDIAVNSTGAGPAERGEIYVVDYGGEGRNHRIQRFRQNDNGTPSNPYDDSFEFVSAWGAGVESGGTDYEICTVAARCKPGLQSAGNGTLGGNGDLTFIQGIDVDQDTGDIYVSEASTGGTSQPNSRISVYSFDGTFLRSFGWDVVESGPDDSGTDYEICVAANGDVCKAGTGGSGVGQIGTAEGIAVSPPDGNPATGTVFLGDGGNHRVGTFMLDGSSPSSFGSKANFGPGPLGQIAVDPRGIVYIEMNTTDDMNTPEETRDDQLHDEIARYDSQNANGGGIGFLAPIVEPPLLKLSNGTEGLEVDPETEALYVLRNYANAKGNARSVIQQFGPLHPAGLTAPPTADDTEHGSIAEFNFVGGLGLDYANDRLFISDLYNIGGDLSDQGRNAGVYVLDAAGGGASATLDSLDEVTATSVTVHGTVDPNGPPDAGVRAEYSTDGVHWDSTPEEIVGSQESPQPVSVPIDPPGGGLQPHTLYHVRLVAARRFNPPVIATPAEMTFTTAAAPPLVETVGSPLRTATTALLNARVDPRNAATTYRFEYGEEGPCNANPCESTSPQPAGSGALYELVSQRVGGLRPNTSYHYRVIADNGEVAAGEGMTVTTRASDASPSHAHFPGPPGSDRAWEQVSLPDTSGNPVNEALAISDNGDRVVYRTHGGNPATSTGNAFNQLFAERTASGWRTRDIYPPRADLVASAWRGLYTNGELSSMVSLNNDNGIGEAAAFRFSPDASGFAKLFEAPAEGIPTLDVSDDGLLITVTNGGKLYDISSGAPREIGLLPDGSSCLEEGKLTFGYPTTIAPRAPHWISADGNLAFFPASCDSEPGALYARDVATETTKLISGPILSGPTCATALVRSTPGAVFFWTRSRLDPVDTSVTSCVDGQSEVSLPGGDIYRYDLGSGALECVTCAVSGIDADVTVGFPADAGIAVAEDGSRVYFHSPHALLAGTGAGIYRVDVASGSLAYVGPAKDEQVGDVLSKGEAISPDGSTLIFTSADPGLNAIGGQQNGGALQYYRYDDNDHSLTCVSCPQDGSIPAAGVSRKVSNDIFETGPNTGPLSDDGEIFAFAAPTALVNADQNTAPGSQNPIQGTDAYEWRDGQLFLLTDGLTNWPTDESGTRGEVPAIDGVDPSGRDIYFTAAAQYTPDALDGYSRMYVARIGGGFEYPAPPKPCPLEVCQGTPNGTPEEQAPGTSTFAGSGNPQPPARHRKAKKKKHKRHAKHAHEQKRHRAKERDHSAHSANRDRRSAR